MTLPNGWNEGRLGAICSIEIGGTPARDVPEYWDLARDTDNAWVSIKDMRRHVINETAEHISDAGVKYSNVKLQPQGTVLLSFKLTIGRVGVAAIPLYTNEAIAALKPRGLLHEYLYHGLQHWDLLQGVDQAIKGATLNKEKLKRIAFVYPKAEAEQSKIAEILSTVDRAIEQTETLIAKQQRIKVGMMQDLLTRGIDERGNLRSEQTHEFKDSPLGRVPVEWDVIELGSSGVWASGGTPSKRISRFWNGDVPWICPKDMKTFDLANSIERITQEAAQCGSRIMPKGTVFIVIRGMILAHTFPVGYATRPMAFNQDVKAVIAKPGLSSRYLAYWLVAHAHAILKIATTATHGTKRFDMDDLFAVSVAVPKREEQEQITSAFDGREHQIDLLRSHSSKLRSLKTGLMQDLLTGNRRVTALLTQPGDASA